ncbi:hypothetical protein Taro_003955 [Colocasia esculenta]|uniref:Uncharacterized protein n=1 Tax=Colocasia esculenta TaxID=4460 RepID=A0A843TQB2_COLES|nr:hypothetical protein [Colocasia esculenta]
MGCPSEAGRWLSSAISSRYGGPMRCLLQSSSSSLPPSSPALAAIRSAFANASAVSLFVGEAQYHRRSGAPVLASNREGKRPFRHRIPTFGPRQPPPVAAGLVASPASPGSFLSQGGIMNFLLRSATSVVQDAPAFSEDHPKGMQSISGPVKTLEGLIAEDPFPSSGDDGDKDHDRSVLSTLTVDPTAENNPSIGSHSDVSEDEGWITIPYKELPEDWSDASDIHSFRSLDRHFVFPGEQLHILACLAASKQDTDVITPFRVAAVMCKNGSPARNCKQPSQVMDAKAGPPSEKIDINGNCQDVSSKNIEENGENKGTTDALDTQQDISVTESLLRMESHKRRTQILLEKFRNSHFFARIAESDEPLWSRGSASEEKNVEPRKALRKNSLLNAFIDRGNFDGNASGGVARNAVKCCALHNGDIVVLLQVNVGIGNMRDPVLEILQFEKFKSDGIDSGSHANEAVTRAEDPYGELLTWLLPLDRALPPAGRPLSPPLASVPGIGSASQKSTTTASSGSQLFSFGHFRSYSMPAMPPVTIPSTPVVPPSNSKPNFDLEDFDRFSSEGSIKNKEVGMEGLLSFRGVPLEPQRFSARCGLEGIYLPGRRWRKKLEIIRPVEIHSFAAECNTEDLICVQIKNVSPAHMPDITIYIDAITIVFEEAPKDCPPVSLPISCIEAGNDYSLPDLALRSSILLPFHKLKDVNRNNSSNVEALAYHNPHNSDYATVAV